MISEVSINQQFSNFLNKYEEVILKLFILIKQFKKDIPDTYKYSLKYPPPRSNYKYTDKLFIGCIVYIILNNCSWLYFIGPIPGKQVHKRFKEYCKNNLFLDLYNTALQEYLCTDTMEKMKIISIDSTTINNKNCNEKIKRNPYLKNKKCIKITSIVDSRGFPITLSIDPANNHDSKLFNNNFVSMLSNKTISDKINKSTILLADKVMIVKPYETKLRHQI